MDEDQANEIRDAFKAIANAVTPTDAAGTRDAHGGYVSSLTEAVVSVGRSLDAIAAALADIAEAIRDHAAAADLPNGRGG